MKTFFILLLIFAYFYNKKKEYGLYVIIFLIPFSFTVVPTSGTWQSFPISISGILVILFYLLSYFRKYSYSHNSYYQALNFILLFDLLWGFVFTLIYFSEAVIQHNKIIVVATQLENLSPTFQAIFHSGNLVVCILFLNLLRKHFQVKNNIVNAAYIFSLTIIPMFMTQLLEIAGILFSIFSGTRPITINDPRYFGLYNSFGFGIYVAIVIAFSLIFKFRFYKITIIIAVVYGLLSGERQALIFPFIVLAFFYLFIEGSILKKLTLILSFCIGIFLLLNTFTDKFNGIRRLLETFYLSKDTSIIELSGRGGETALMDDFLDAIIHWPITGKGLFNWGEFEGIASGFANHVVWLNYYQKFGLIGCILFLTAILYLLYKLIILLTINKYKEQYAMLSSLMICFIGQQFLDNFFWFTDTMLLYIFMFSMMFEIAKKYETKNSPSKL